MKKRWIIIFLIAVIVISFLLLVVLSYIVPLPFDYFWHDWGECELLVYPGGGYPVDPTHPNCKDFKRGIIP